MSTEASHRQRLPAPCRHCRGVLYQRVDTCPYCGTPHPLDFAAPPPAPVAHATVRAVLLPDKPVPAVTPDLPSAAPPSAAVTRPAPWRFIASAPQRFIARAPRAFTAHTAAHTAARTAARSGAAPRGLLALAVVVAIAGAYGLYTLAGNHAGSQSSDHTQDTQTTTGMIAARDSAVPHSSDDARAPATPPLRDIAQGLAAARAHRDAHDLGGAQAALDATLSIAPQNADARALQHELAPLEAQRDVALQAARTCRANRQWPCVAQRASDALAIDRGSADAQALLERAIVETGWTQPGARATSSQAAQAAAASAAIDPQIRAITASGWRHAPGVAASAPAR